MVKLSPFVKKHVDRLQHRVDVAQRRIERKKNIEEEAEVINRLSSIIESMRKTNQFQEFKVRPLKFIKKS